MKIRLLEAKKDTKIEVENPGLLEVPEGKKVYDLPVSHFKKLIDKNGRAAVIRAINALQVWNKNDDPKIASWAKKMKKSLEGYGEKKTKNESFGYRDMYHMGNLTATYIFPTFTYDDRSVARRDYNLTILGNNKDGTHVQGKLQDLEGFADEYLGYELVDDYLDIDYDSDDRVDREYVYRESLKESSLNEEHTMVKEEIEELDDAIKEAIHQTQIVSQTHEDRETRMLMRKVRELLNQARNLY